MRSFFLTAFFILVHFSIEVKNSKPIQQPFVFDCFVYEGENQLLDLKLNSMSSFVDYFILIEGSRTKEGAQKYFRYNAANFLKHANKILYLPFRNYPFDKQGLSISQALQNRKSLLNSANAVFDYLGNPRDALIFSRIGDILEESAVEAFLKQKLDYACPETVVHSEYLDRRQVHGDNGKTLPNLWDEGARILTLASLNSSFENSPFAAMQSQWCSKKVKPTLKNAGWSFLLEKDREIADKISSKYSNSRLEDLPILKQSFPEALVADLENSQDKSVYSKLLSGTSEQGRKLSRLYMHRPERKSLHSIDRVVFDSFIYNGQSNLLPLKLAISNSYVDFFVIAEGHYTHTGIPKNLSFNISAYPEQAHKILYMPIRNFPYTIENSDFKLEQSHFWINEHNQRDKLANILLLAAADHDVLITEDLDEIVSRDAFMKFDPSKDKVATFALRSYNFYFNRQSFFYNSSGELQENRWYLGSKVVVFKYFKQDFKAICTTLRGQCGIDILSGAVNYHIDVQYKCKGPIIPSAGWHFSYVLTDHDIQKKIMSFTHSAAVNLTIADFKKYREKDDINEFAFNRNVQLIGSGLPEQLVDDILSKGNQSSYAPFVYGLDYEKFPYTQSMVHNSKSSERYEASTIVALVFFWFLGIAMVYVDRKLSETYGSRTNARESPFYDREECSNNFEPENQALQASTDQQIGISS